LPGTAPIELGASVGRGTELLGLGTELLERSAELLGLGTELLGLGAELLGLDAELLGLGAELLGLGDTREELLPSRSVKNQKINDSGHTDQSRSDDYEPAYPFAYAN
jgi:hypothetical protein